MPKVSVIIPTYNNPEQLERSVESVLKQTYQDYEVLIVNDGSTADYGSIKAKYAKNSSILFFDKENEGPGIARQTGLDNARGDYIQYLDAGDELLSHKLEKQVGILDTASNVIMTYGLSMIEGSPNQLHRSKMQRHEFEDLMKVAIAVRKWHTSAPLWNYKKEQYWSNYFNGEDVYHDFTVALKNEGKVHFLDEILVNLVYDNPEGGLSNASTVERNQRRFVNDCMGLNFYIVKKLKETQSIKKSAYREALSERMYHVAMRVNLTGYKEESLVLANAARRITKSPIKFLEILILQLIIHLPIEKKRPIFQFIYKVRRKLLSPNIHQYRYI